MGFKIAFFLILTVFLILSEPRLLEDSEEIILTQENKIQIPAIYLEDEICFLERDVCLKEGVWMKYFDERGNILLTGHSFTIVPFGAGVFYGLSGLKKGDFVYIYLDESLVYVIEDVFVTSRYDLSVENFERVENTLVLYSCFPLWSASQRIVVRATLCNLCEYEL